MDVLNYKAILFEGAEKSFSFTKHPQWYRLRFPIVNLSKEFISYKIFEDGS